MDYSTQQVMVGLQKNTRCPVCQTDFLQVFETENTEQYLTCPVCGVKFKSAPNTDHLMFIETPINFPNNLVGLWLSRAQIGKALHDYRMNSNRNGVDQPNVNKAIGAPQSNPLRAQAVRMARGLISEGKSPEYVTEMLSKGMKLSRFTIEDIIKDAVAVKKAKQKQTINLVIYTFIGLLTLIGVFLLYLSFFHS